MKISELIEQLQGFVAEHGDRVVVVYDDMSSDLDGMNPNFNLDLDDYGRLTVMPF